MSKDAEAWSLNFISLKFMSKDEVETLETKKSKKV